MRASPRPPPASEPDTPLEMGGQLVQMAVERPRRRFLEKVLALVQRVDAYALPLAQGLAQHFDVKPHVLDVPAARQGDHFSPHHPRDDDLGRRCSVIVCYARDRQIVKRPDNASPMTCTAAPTSCGARAKAGHYASRMRDATCFLRDRTPGIHTPPSPVHSMPNARLTILRLPSHRNWLPSAIMSVTMRRTHA